MGKYLILLTNQFPHVDGDHAFIKNEIDALASEFDEVAVMTFDRQTTEVQPDLPSNVWFAGTVEDKADSRVRLGWLLLTSLLDRFRLVRQDKSIAVGQQADEQRVHGAALAIKGARKILDLIWEQGWKRDEVVVYAFWAMHAGLSVAALPPSLGIKSAVRFHGYDLYEERRGYLPQRKALLENASLLAPISDHGARYLLENYRSFIDPAKLQVHRLGTRDHGANPPSDTPCLEVLSCSYMKPVKNVDRIARVLDRVAEQIDVHWTHIGDGPERERVADTIADLRSLKRITLPGAMTNDEVIDYYRRTHVDLFVNLSDSEGVPVSVMEAMSFGIPVAATDVGGTGEIVSDTLKSGVLVDPSATDEEIAAQILNLVDHMAEQDPRAAWEQLSDGERNSREFAATLASLLEQS